MYRFNGTDFMAYVRRKADEYEAYASQNATKWARTRVQQEWMNEFLTYITDHMK